MNSVRLHYLAEKRAAREAVKLSNLAYGRHSKVPGAGNYQRKLMCVAVKKKPLTSSDIIRQENLWARMIASTGLPLHAVDNPELKALIDDIGQGRSSLPDRRALSTTILDRAAAIVDVSMAAAVKGVKGGTLRRLHAHTIAFLYLM